ncbi:MAG: 16S rRNA (cytosine(1402)-N(4))-methyltransferase RsmH [Gemmatimonadaceae bacterium]
MPPLAEQPFESRYHAPVMAREVLTALSRSGTVLDCTLGGGGHALALLEQGAMVTGVDRDPDALLAAAARLESYSESGRFRAVRGDFTRLAEIGEIGVSRFDGILTDLGVSSWQLDADERGFSFRPGVVRDMRMSGEGVGSTAADVLNEETASGLERIFRDYGDEPRARRLTAEVTRRRERRPFRTSDDFVDAIRGALGASSGPGDFARLFQALRIAVNDELSGLERALPELRDRLTPGGVLVVIAYHSGEDRLVKHAMRDWSTACHCPPRQPICICGGVAIGKLVTRRALRADAQEMAVNPRSRSARMRVWQKSD